MTGESLNGDNFRVVGSWKITQGRAWRHWQIEALVACRKAALAAGDEVSAMRYEARIDALRREPPDDARPRRRGGDPS